MDWKSLYERKENDKLHMFLGDFFRHLFLFGFPGNLLSVGNVSAITLKTSLEISSTFSQLTERWNGRNFQHEVLKNFPENFQKEIREC